MLLGSLNEIEQAIRASWSLASCDPVDIPDWSPENPARGQCGVTSLLLIELLGGELMLADVLYPDGTKQGVHYWLRLAGGLEVDITREQFHPGEVVIQPARAVPPPPVPFTGRLASQYAALRDPVLLQLSP